MPTILIIAGPNGAGKTTFANAWFEERGETAPFLNADEIGRTELGHLQGGALKAPPTPWNLVNGKGLQSPPQVIGSPSYSSRKR
jgi:septin family protein